MLIASAGADSSILEQLSGKIGDLLEGGDASSLSPEIQDQFKSLLAIPEHASNLIIQKYILANLRFDGMYQRFESISEAHSKTLRWIFSHEYSIGSEAPPLDAGNDESDSASNNTRIRADPARLLEVVKDVPSDADSNRFPSHHMDDTDQRRGDLEIVDKEKYAAKEALLTWLSSGNGIFHISGKLGSGKSTLMKSLCEHKSTVAMLKQWAGGQSSSFLAT